MFRLIVVLLTLMSVGCGHHSNVVSRVDAGAGAERIAVVVDPGLTAAMDGKAIAQYQQVADFMREDLILRLQRQGYKVERLKQSSDFTQGQGQRLLAVKIERYNPGSKAARIIVGMGAGSASLNISYSVTAETGRTLVSTTDGVGSSRGWSFCCHTLNERLVAVMGSDLALPN